MSQFVVFEAYVSEFNELLNTTKQFIDELRDEKKASLSPKISGNMSQLDNMIKQMNIEIKSAASSSAERKLLQDRVSELNAQLTGAKNDYRRAEEIAGRSALIGEQSARDRERVMTINDKLNNQNELIMNATRTVMETEEVGAAITSELARNREKIEGAQEKGRTFNAQMDSAGKITRSMEARNARQCVIS